MPVCSSPNLSSFFKLSLLCLVFLRDNRANIFLPLSSCLLFLFLYPCIFLYSSKHFYFSHNLQSACFLCLVEEVGESIFHAFFMLFSHTFTIPFIPIFSAIVLSVILTFPFASFYIFHPFLSSFSVTSHRPLPCFLLHSYLSVHQSFATPHSSSSPSILLIILSSLPLLTNVSFFVSHSSSSCFPPYQSFPLTSSISPKPFFIKLSFLLLLAHFSFFPLLTNLPASTSFTSSPSSSSSSFLLIHLPFLPLLTP